MLSCQILTSEFQARRAFIDSAILKERNRLAKIFEAYPCFRELHHPTEEPAIYLQKEHSSALFWSLMGPTVFWQLETLLSLHLPKKNLVKVLKKLYGDGQGTMQYVTSVLNEWGQFVTTAVVVAAAAESEGFYARMARGLIARFRRANASAPKVLYTDNNCCRNRGMEALADNSDLHLVPVDLRQKIITTSSLHEHDKTAARFVKQYESRWGYTLFGRCLGADSPETRAAQKTKFGWMKYPQVAQVTEGSRLLYLLLKMLKNRAPANQLSSPSKRLLCCQHPYYYQIDLKYSTSTFITRLEKGVVRSGGYLLKSQNQLLWTGPFCQSLPRPPTFSQSLLRPPTNHPRCRQHPYPWFFLHSHRLPPSYFMDHHAVRALYL
ncbi:hypothetical protein D9C73_027729 [Collichthys lucidus]|uniref:Uncharacterized protein n=1 Tax=Collichthys lucidus TaxID=240159 RepID=A0A4U5TTT1_COLLU|nr:hypothetical protein D9C73_027729 [Collichthys lucidus]